jgi:hypothetical protein
MRNITFRTYPNTDLWCGAAATNHTTKKLLDRPQYINYSTKRLNGSKDDLLQGTIRMEAIMEPKMILFSCYYEHRPRMVSG